MTRTIILLAILMVVIAPSSTKAQRSMGKESLRGLKGVYVLVESMDEDVEREGLRKDQLQTDAELKLRKAGIHVATRAEGLSNPNIGTLYISVGAFKSSTSGLYAFSISVELRQGVQLLRNASIKVDFATTYSVPEIFGMTGADHLRDGVRSAFNDKVDVFLNDYLAMNPK